MHLRRVPDGGRTLTVLLIAALVALAVLDCMTGTGCAWPWWPASCR
ncbi:hypothetical protein ACFQ2B_10315 [Streptomyces stramineus]